MKFLSNKEIQEKYENNKCCLLGQIPLTDDECKNIIEYAKYIISLEPKYINDGADLVLSMALVLVAINDYQDGKYWEMLKNKLELEDLSIQKQNLLGRIFLNTIREYNMFELHKNENGTMRYVENIKAHAFVTNNYMFGFFDFLDDYYENNLLRDITDGVEDTLQDLSDYIKTTLEKKNDIIYSDSLNGQTTKSYKLLKSTREVIAQCSGDTLYQLLYPALKLIDDKFYDDIIPDNKDRFVLEFKQWHYSKEQKERKSGSKREQHNKRPYICMDYKNNKFFLVIPKRIYRKKDCEGNVKVRITDGFTSREYSLEVYEHLGSYISEEKRIILTDPFGEIEIDFETLIIEKFQIKNDKYYAIFNEKHNNINRLELGYNYLLIDNECKVEFSNEDDCIERDIYDEDYYYYYLNVSENTTCYINGKPLSILGEYSKEPIFENEINDFFVYNLNNDRIVASLEHPIISLDIKTEKIKGTTILVNNRNFSIENENAIKIYNYPDNQHKKIVIANLNELVRINNGKYKVYLNIPGENNKFICEYLILKDLIFEFDKRRYVEEQEANLTVKTYNLDFRMLSENVKVISCAKYISTYKVTLNSDIKELNCEIILDSEIYNIIVPLRLRLYGSSIDNLFYEKKDFIWYSDLKNLMYIKMPGAKKLGIYYGKDDKNVIYGEEIDHELFRVNISDFINQISNNSKLRYHYLNIKYEDTRERWMPLYTILKTVDIRPYFELKCFDGVIGFEINSILAPNKAKVFIAVKQDISDTNTVIYKSVVEGINLLPELKKEKIYTICPRVEESDEFGWNKKTYTLPKKRFKITKEGFINCQNTENNTKKNVMNRTNKYDKFSGYRVTIENIVYMNNLLSISNNYKYYIMIRKKEKDYYIGDLYEIVFNNGDKTQYNGRQIIGKVKLLNFRNIGDKAEFSLLNYLNFNENGTNLYYMKIHKNIKTLREIKSDEAIELQYQKLKIKAKIKRYKEK